MPKEPLLFHAIGGMSCKARGLRVFWFLSRRTEHVFDSDKVFDCVSLCGKKPLSRRTELYFSGECTILTMFARRCAEKLHFTRKRSGDL